MDIISKFRSTYPKLIEPEELNSQYLKSINTNAKFQKRISKEDKSYFQKLLLNSIYYLPKNLLFPDIRELLSLQNINTSQESSTKKYSYLKTPSSVEIITNDLEQTWANDDLIAIKKGDYISWLSNYSNDYSIGKVVKFTSDSAFVRSYTEDDNASFSADPYEENLIKINRSKIILSNVTFTKQGTMTVKTAKLIENYFHHEFQKAVVSDLDLD